jgi:hypothetical protein
VIQQDARGCFQRRFNGLAVDGDRIPRCGAVAQLGDLPVDGDPAGRDPGLDLAART